MKAAKLALLCLLILPMGCHSTTAATPPLAPGYVDPTDQTLGQTLSALNAFVVQEKSHFNSLTVDQQAKERPVLNPLIDAVNVANSVYRAFHAGTANEAAASAAISQAQATQSGFASAKGVK